MMDSDDKLPARRLDNFIYLLPWTSEEKGIPEGRFKSLKLLTEVIFLNEP